MDTRRLINYLVAFNSAIVLPVDRLSRFEFLAMTGFWVTADGGGCIKHSGQPPGSLPEMGFYYDVLFYNSWESGKSEGCLCWFFWDSKYFVLEDSNPQDEISTFDTLSENQPLIS